MNKKSLLLLLLPIMVSCSIPSNNKKEVYDFEYTLSNNEIHIDSVLSSKKNSLKTLQIPTKIDGYYVTSIETNAFNGISTLEKVNFESDSRLSEISSEAFSDCSNLKEFNFPNSLCAIGQWAFANCTSLTGLDFTSTNLKFVGSGAFSGCLGVSLVNSSPYLETIGDETFMDCTSLEKVSISSEIKEIGYEAFNNDIDLTIYFSGISEIPSTFVEDWNHTSSKHKNGTNYIEYTFVNKE